MSLQFTVVTSSQNTRPTALNLNEAEKVDQEKSMKLLHNTGFQGNITNKLTILFDRWEKVNFDKIDFQASLNWREWCRLQESIVFNFTAF